MIKANRWVKLKSFSSEIEADLVLGLLRANDLPAEKFYPGLAQPIKIYMGTAMGVEVHILQEHFELASRLLQEMEASND